MMILRDKVYDVGWNVAVGGCGHLLLSAFL